MITGTRLKTTDHMIWVVDSGERTWGEAVIFTLVLMLHRGHYAIFLSWVFDMTNNCDKGILDGQTYEQQPHNMQSFRLASVTISS